MTEAQVVVLFILIGIIAWSLVRIANILSLWDEEDQDEQ